MDLSEMDRSFFEHLYTGALRGAGDTGCKRRGQGPYKDAQ